MILALQSKAQHPSTGLAKSRKKAARLAVPWISHVALSATLFTMTGLGHRVPG
jgi:hypothetical protein